MNKRNFILVLTLGAVLSFGVSSYARLGSAFTKIGTTQGVALGTVIHKIVDDKENVVCYILAPEGLTNKIGPGHLAFDGNSAGSLSCVMRPPKAAP